MLKRLYCFSLFLFFLISGSTGFGFNFNPFSEGGYRKYPEQLIEQIREKLDKQEDVDNELDKLIDLVKRAKNLNAQSINNVTNFMNAMKEDFDKPTFLRSEEFKKAQLIAKDIEKICIDVIERREKLIAPDVSLSKDDLNTFLIEAETYINEEIAYMTGFGFAFAPHVKKLPKKYLENYLEYSKLLKEQDPSK